MPTYCVSSALGHPIPPRSVSTLAADSAIELDLKQPHAITVCLKLCEQAEIIFEGNRPGVMERLGLGPEVVLARNPRIVYGRMTGWGQSGPYAPYAGHDINYLSLSGALHAIGTEDKPVPPLNLAADYGGGAMFLAVGLLAGLIHSRASGKGQVIDAAMTDGSAYLMSYYHGNARCGPLDGSPSQQSTRRRSAVLRHLLLCGWEMDLDRCARATILCPPPRKDGFAEPFNAAANGTRLLARHASNVA